MSILDYIQKNMYANANKLCNGNYHDTQDLIQDTLFKFLLYGDKYQELPFENQKNIAYRIMYNSFLSTYNKRKKECSLLYCIPVQSDISEYESYMNYLVSSKRKCIKAFFLFFCGYKVKEISEITGTTIGTVGANISKARKTIKEYFKLAA